MRVCILSSLSSSIFFQVQLVKWSLWKNLMDLLYKGVCVCVCQTIKQTVTTAAPARFAHPLVLSWTRLYLSQECWSRVQLSGVVSWAKSCESSRRVLTGRHFPPGRRAEGWSRGRTPPSRPGLSLSGRRSGWWRDAPSWALGGWAAATELRTKKRGVKKWFS